MLSRSHLRILVVCGITLIFLLTASVLAQDRPIEDGWRGIKVFQTKRADIEKLFAEKPIQNENAMRFSSEEDVIEVIFSGTPCTLSSKGTIFYNFEKDTVISYSVGLLKPILVSQLKWLKKGYDRWEDNYHRVNVNYRNETIGVDVNVLIDRSSGVEEVFGFRFYPPKGKEFANSCKPK